MRKNGIKEGNTSRTSGIYRSCFSQYYNKIPPRRSGKPYITHILDMLDFCLKDGIIDPRVLNGIILHDVVEECLQKNSEDEIKTHLREVRSNQNEIDDMMLLTHDTDESKLEHMRSLLEKRNPYVVIVKSYDVYQNMSVDFENLNPNSQEIKREQKKLLEEFLSKQRPSFFSGIRVVRNSSPIRNILLGRLQEIDNRN